MISTLLRTNHLCHFGLKRVITSDLRGVSPAQPTPEWGGLGVLLNPPRTCAGGMFSFSRVEHLMLCFQICESIRSDCSL